MNDHNFTINHIEQQVLDSQFETKKTEFKEYYAARHAAFMRAEKAFRNLLQQLMQTEHFSQPKVTSRLKDRDECIRKLSVKYRNEAEKTNDYSIKDYITDVIGVRVVCLYENDIAKVEEIVRKNFNVIQVTDKSKNLTDSIRHFGYKGLHFDLGMTDERCLLPEYYNLLGIKFELQVRSIVQDAWSEVEHRLRYKKQPPADVHRRTIRLAALFDLADQEFSALNAETERQVAEAMAPGAGDVFDRQLNAITFLAIMHKFHPNYRFEDKALDGFVDEIKEMDASFSLKDLNTAIDRFRNTVWNYKQHQRKSNININPFTEIRHVLYAFDRKKFQDMLYPNQRNAFDGWLNENT